MLPDQHKRSVGEATARRLAASCTAVLTAPVRSVILHGSLALGDFLPGRSDIDLLVVVERALTETERDALVEVVLEADLGPAKGIDLHVVTAEVAAAPPNPPRLDLHVGRYSPSNVETTRAEDAPDLLPELSMARDHGVSLAGSEPLDALGPVPPEWLRERARHWVGFWRTVPDDREFAAFMVLTACRMWRFREEGVHCSKSEAGRWALARDPSLTAITEALRQRAGNPATPVAAEGVARVLEAVHLRLNDPE